MARPRQDLIEREWKKVDKNGPEGCWLYKGTIGNKDGGYGKIALPTGGPKRYAMAHRFFYELVKGPIPEGMELHHKCRVRHCVNPDHLEPVSREEHRKHPLPYVAPLMPPRAKPNVLKEVCGRCGQPYDYFHNGKRYCLSCIKDRQRQNPNLRQYVREWETKKRAAKKAEKIANGTYRPTGSAPGEKRGGGPKKWRTSEYIREQARLRQQRLRAKQRVLAKKDPVARQKLREQYRLASQRYRAKQRSSSPIP